MDFLYRRLRCLGQEGGFQEYFLGNDFISIENKRVKYEDLYIIFRGERMIRAGQNGMLILLVGHSAGHFD